MDLGILRRINLGYEQLEPTILGLMAMNRSFMLLGRHGTGKTRLARALSLGYGEDGFVFYDATKDDLISIAGLPDPEAIKSGELRFIPHDRTIWNKGTVVVDEITRASKENQNLWLEIMEERTCFGLPLAYRSLIATANPESYAAAFQLDDALLDRFYAVLPVPELQGGVAGDMVEEMVQLSMATGPTVEPTEIARVFVEIQTAYSVLLAEGGLAKVSRYLGMLIPPLIASVSGNMEPEYISPRTYSRNLPQTILAVAAYFRVAGTEEPLTAGATEALRYAIATKLQIRPVVLEQFHDTAKAALKLGTPSKTESVKLQLAALTGYEERLAYLKENWQALQETVGADSMEKVLGELLRGASVKGERERLVELKHTLDELGYHGEALRQVDGRLLMELNKAISTLRPRLGRIRPEPGATDEAKQGATNIAVMFGMIDSGTFLGNAMPEVRRLKTYLIDLHEGDVSGDPGDVLSFFATLNLPRQLEDHA